MRKATLGKLLGANGLLLLAFSPVAWFTASDLAALGLAIIGLGLVLAFFATNYGQLGQFASKRSTFFVTSTIATALVVLAALAAVNYIAAKRNKSWDLTSKRIYSLAPQTVSTLEGLPDKVTALAFLTPDHPYYEALIQILRRYHDQAPDKFDYEVKDPTRHPDLAAKYSLKKDDTTVVLVRGQGDQATHTSLGIVSEQELTNALMKLASVGQQKVYFLAGHGEWALDPGPQNVPAMSELRRQLVQEGYAPEPLNLAGKTEVPRDASLVVIAGPRVALTAGEVTALRAYLGQGGRVLLFVDEAADGGPELGRLLSEYGVEIDPGLVADQVADQSIFTPLSAFYGEHEITNLLAALQMNVRFETVRALTLLRQGMLEGVSGEPLVFTSPYAWVETTPTAQAEPSTGEKTGQVPMVVAITRPTANAEGKRFDQARWVVFGDSELLLDSRWGNEGNRNLVMNALGWASNQIAKVTIRPPDRDVSTLDITPALLEQLRLISLTLLPLALLSIGLTIWLKRRNQ